EFAAMGTKARDCAGLILAHKTAVTGHIGGENGRKPALYPLPAHDEFSLNAIPFEFSSRRVFQLAYQSAPPVVADQPSGAATFCALRPRPEAAPVQGLSPPRFQRCAADR